MAQTEEYVCSRCGQPTARDLLTVKKASFLEMGVRGRTLLARVVAWLCPRCVASDEDYNREPYTQPRYEGPSLQAAV
jgi:hypothetical protein